jgi:hypothetical protein
MLNLQDISKQFEEKRDAIKGYAKERSEASREYQKALEQLKTETMEANQRLPRYSGARILEGGITKPFPHKWKTLKEAQDWMDKTLSNITVGAVDGSQIYPDKNYSIPIAVIQTSTIYNKHTGDNHFKQTTRAIIITPEEFEAAHIYAYSNEFVDAHRFKAECEELQQLLSEHENIFALMDGSLILSHINTLNKNIRNIYIRAIKKLLHTSKNTQNPVIAYTDNTHPRDLTHMLHYLYNLKKTKLQDTCLLQYYLRWGDRTSTFLCDRDDRRTTDGTPTPSTLDRYEEYRDSIAFFYINLGSLGRAEYPRWAYEQGLTEKIANILRAESIIRGGYPDLLIQAHKTALIQTREHALFHQLFENFCHAHNIPLPRSTKQQHKKLLGA